MKLKSRFLLTLGIDSAFSLVEGVVAGGIDKWKLNRQKATLIICLLAFLDGLIHCLHVAIQGKEKNN